MELDYEDAMMAPMLARFRRQVAKVAAELRATAQEVERRLASLPEDADYDALYDLACEVLHVVDRGHDGHHLYHNVFGTLQDVHQAHFAREDLHRRDEEERQRLATPPTDSWDYLQRLGADRTQHITCRLRVGSRWHRGYLNGMRVRDNTRASKSQYATIFEHNFDTLEVKVGNKFVPFAEAFPLEDWKPPMEPCGNRGGEQLCAADDPTRCATHHDMPDYHR